MKCARPEKGRGGLCTREWGADRGNQLMRGGRSFPYGISSASDNMPTNQGNVVCPTWTLEKPYLN